MQGARVKQKHIESFLQDIEGFDKNEKDKWELEQHQTPPDIAASVIFQIYQRELEEDLSESTVLDLGCGTGTLMAGMLYVGTDKAIGLEIDDKYVRRCQEQLTEKFEGHALFDLVNIDVKSWKNPYKNTKICDITVMNPPFGTKVEGIDVAFLEKAISEEWNYKFEVIEEFTFPLVQRFKGYHKKDTGYTEVDFIALTPK